MKLHQKKVKIALFIFVAVISMLIGYAVISDVILTTNGNAKVFPNQSNFNVKFVQKTNVSPKVEPSNMGEATVVDDTTATFNISGDMRKGDSVVVTYKIINNSKGIGADIDLSLINSNTEYYQVTETITDKQLQAGEATTATVTVEMIENPFEIDQSTTITAKLIANPVDDEIAISNDPKSVKVLLIQKVLQQTHGQL